MGLTGAVRVGLVVGFIGGLFGGESLGMVLVGLAAFVQAIAVRQAPWRWAILSISSWTAGSTLIALLNLFAERPMVEVLTPLSIGLTLVAAYASALAGASLSWVASRMVEEG